MPTALAVFASLCVLGEPQQAVAVGGFVRPMESMFASPILAAPTLAYETHFVVRRGHFQQVIRLRTNLPVRINPDGRTLIPSCNPIS